MAGKLQGFGYFGPEVEWSLKVYWRIWPEGRIRGVLHVLFVGSRKGAQDTDVSR